MFQSSRSRLLLYYLLVMAAILCLFSAAFFLLFSRSLYHQVDKNLETLVRVAAPSLGQIGTQGHRYLENLDEVPWRDIFNSEQQSLEWFDAQGRLLASQGKLKLLFPPKSGFWTLKGDKALIPYPIQTFTLSVAIDRSTQGQPPVEGYIRSSQTTEKLQQVQNQFLWQLGSSVLIVLGLIGVSGIWLTKKALEPVMQSFRQLQQFTADASHELRGPLTAIKASVDVMRNHPERFQAKDVKKLGAIASATEQMTHLTQDLLFLARTEAKGKEAISEGEWHCISLDALLEDLFDWLEPLAQEKDIHFDYHCLNQAKIRGDRSQLSRLFANLLENALNYTPQGGQVTLRLALQNNLAVVSVIDTGIGIPQESLPLVFDRFWRADQARSYRQGGTGLGLTIAQAIVRRHGGQITVKSQQGQGSCFQVCLPLYRPEAANRMTRWSSWKSLRSWSTLKSHQSSDLLKKSALVVAILSLAVLPIFMILVAFKQVKTFDGLQFPQGGSSFADEVVFYQADVYSPPIKETLGNLDNPLAALGIPNSGHHQRFSFFDKGHPAVKLGKGGSLSLKFTNNLLSGDGQPTDDLRVFTGGKLSAPLAVAISQDAIVWHGVGYIDNRQGGIDLDRWGWGKEDLFSYVRLTHGTLEGQSSQGSYSEDMTIDAVGAVSSVTIVPSTRGYLPLASPHSRAILVLILIVVLSLGVRYWWRGKKHAKRNSR